MKVEGKVALITGAASGMGKGFAESLLKAGANVSVVDYNAETGALTTQELTTTYGEDRVIFCKCDITSQTEFEDAFKRTKEKFGCIDIVVNNAGIGGETDDIWEKVVDINVKGTLRGTRLGMHYLSKENGGNGGLIVNMSSAGGLNPNPFSPTYGCTKAGIIHATRCYAISPAAVQSNIRLMVMCPAFVDTPLFRNLASGDSSQTIGAQPEQINAFIQHIGVLTIEEVAESFMEMVADDSKNGLILTCAKHTGTKYGTLALQSV